MGESKVEPFYGVVARAAFPKLGTRDSKGSMFWFETIEMKPIKACVFFCISCVVLGQKKKTCPPGGPEGRVWETLG
jgi:hypothetical protein